MVKGLILPETTQLGFIANDSYHMITFGPHNRFLKKLQILIYVYANKTFAESYPGDYITLEKINVSGSLYDQYFNGTNYTNGSPEYPDADAQTFLKENVKPVAGLTDAEAKNWINSRFDYTTASNA